MSFNTLFYIKIYTIENQRFMFIIENMFYKSVFWRLYMISLYGYVYFDNI